MRGVGVIYNDIGLALTHTNSVVVTNVSSEDGVDYLYSKVTIDVNCVLNPEETSYQFIPPEETPGELPADTYTIIWQALMTKRKPLIFQNFGSFIWSSPEALAPTDLNNGPDPERCTILRIDGGTTIHLNYVITFYTSICDAQDGQVEPVAILSHRFGQSMMVDVDFYTTINTVGRVYFRTDILYSNGQMADQFRSNVVPFCPPGFRRAQMQWEVDSKNNILAYQIVDIELAYNLGNTGEQGSGTYITRAEGVYSQSTIGDSKNDGIPAGMQSGVMTLKLYGSKRAANWVLTQLAFAAITSRLPIGQPALGFVRHISIQQNATRREVTVVVAMQLNVRQNGPIGGFNTTPLAVADNFIWGGDFNGTNPLPPNDNGTRGTASLVMLQSAITEFCSGPQDPPCYQSSDQGEGGGGNPDDGGGGGGGGYCGPPAVISIIPTNLLPVTPNKYSTSTTEDPYTRATINSRYQNDQGVKQAPRAYTPDTYVAGGGGSGGGGGSTSPGDQSYNASSASYVNLYAAVTRRIVEWSAERVGGPPVIPAYQSSDPNQVLLDKEFSPLDPQVLPDGNSIVYTISGTYIFGYKNNLDTVGSIPWDTNQWVSFGRYDISPITLPGAGSTSNEQVVHGLIDPQDSGGGGSMS